ncbi:MAG TPA: AI-2E family transporter, partial [Actinomycetota bacterium]|nr:AI-2E family transporter [Actinomycetota bacterium]
MDDGRSRMLNPAVARVARWGIVAWSAIGVVILAYFAYRYLLRPIRVVFPPLVLALVLVYLLNPIVSRLQRRGIPRGWATLLTYVVFLTIVGLGMRFLVPLLAEQVSGFIRGLPGLLDRVQVWISDLAERFNLNIDARQIVSDLGPGGGGGEFIGRIFSFTAGILHVAVIVILGPILAFYLLVDLPKIQRGFDALIPMKRRDEVRSILDRMSRALGGFFRGQLLVALFVGLASMFGLWVVGLPYWALVGMIAGLFNLIPLVGPFIGAVPALFIAFTTVQSEGLLHLDPGWPLALGASAA